MRRTSKIVIFILILMSFLVMTQSQTHDSLLRVYKDEHNLLGIKGQWTGSDCDQECHQAQGVVCGRVWKECCALGCQGVVQVTCKQDKFISDSELKCFDQKKTKNISHSKILQKSQQTSSKPGVSQNSNSIDSSPLTISHQNKSDDHMN